MTKDRSETIQKSQWFERIILIVILIIGLQFLGGGKIATIGAIIAFIWAAVLFVLEALWTLELQLEEIKEEFKLW